MTLLSWGVKDTFVEYVQHHGSVTTVVPSLPTGEFCFIRTSTAEGVWRFEGTVEFDAHAGLLKASVSDPWIHFEDGSPYMTVAGTGPTRTLGARLRLVDLPGLTVETALSGDHRAVLSPDGASMFDFRYPAGATMAPIHIS